MPKGQSHSEMMLARYNMMVKKNDRAFQKRHRWKRKALSMFKGEDAARDFMEAERGRQRVVTQAEAKRSRWMDKFEKSLLKR